MIVLDKIWVRKEKEGLFMLLGAIEFCQQTANIWKVLGYVVLIIKIVIPLLLIIFGMVDLGKAVISSDDKAISKSVSSLVRRFIAAVVIFFIPTIVSALFNVLDIMGDEQSDYNVCIQCVTNVNECSTGSAVGNLTGV